jgi:hypothetical protein
MTTGVTADTTMEIDQPTLNLGASEALSVFGGGTVERALIRFDLSSIAPGSLVVAAQRELELVDFGDTVAGDLALRLAGESWSEGRATWNERTTGVAWTSAGGSVSAVLLTAGAQGTAFVFEVPANVPQGWLDTPATNFGFVVGAADELVDLHYHLHTRESQFLTGRPLLVLDLVE